MVKEGTQSRCDLRNRLLESKRSQVHKTIPKVSTDAYKSKSIDEWITWAVETYDEDTPKTDGYIRWSKEQQKEWLLTLPVKKVQ